MKLSQIYLALSIALTFTSCKKDNNAINPILPSLKQTSWNGNISINKNNISSTTDLNLSFDNNRSGNYSIYGSKSAYFSEFSEKTNLTYVQDGRILYIEGGYKNVLTGKWWLVDSRKKILQLVRDRENPQVMDTLTLKKMP